MSQSEELLDYSALSWRDWDRNGTRKDRNDKTVGQKTPQLGLKYLRSLPVCPNYCHSLFIPHFLL